MATACGPRGFEAIAACAIMFVAPFGDGALTPEFSSFVSVEAPGWPIDDMYLNSQDGVEWESAPHPALG